MSPLPICVIRADAAPHIGGGHVMRCVAFAEAWQARGGEAVFVTHCENQALLAKVSAAVPQVVLLDAAHPAPEDRSRVREVLRSASRDRADRGWVVIDGYHLDEAYQLGVRSDGGRVLVIDDYAHLARYHADILLNQNLGTERTRYQSDPDTVFLLGPKYALLRAEFGCWRGWTRTFPPLARRVLVTGGLSAPDDFLLAALDSVAGSGIDGVQVAVVLGARPAGVSRPLSDGAYKGLQIELIENPADLPARMAWADVAIATSGVTAWELAFMGVPTVFAAVAENQRGAARALADCGAAANSGDGPPVPWRSVTSDLAALMNDLDRRRDISVTARALVDGRGAHRVADELALAG